MNETPDFESTTQVLARRAPGLAWIPKVVRDNLSPKALWSSLLALVIAIGYVLNAQHSINQLKDESVQGRQSVSKLQEQVGLLHEIDTQLKVMNTKVDAIAAEVDRQRQWRERIEAVAETPPNARKRR